MKKLALLSMGIGVIPNIIKIVHSFDPSVMVINFVDDGIIRATQANDNVLEASSFQRLMHQLMAAELSGAEALLVTCSSISEFVDFAMPFARIPIFKIDEPMCLEALARGRVIGVAATVATTLAPSLRQVRRLAESKKMSIELKQALVEPAFEAFQRGEIALHDQLVRQSILDLCDTCDVVLLAQASMISVVETLPQEQQAKILSSPYLGVKAVMETMNPDRCPTNR